MSPPRYAWLVSRYPVVSETFILQEMLHGVRRGADVQLYPLMRQREASLHPETTVLAPRAHYARPISWSMLAAQGYWLRRRPRVYLRAWRRALWGNRRSTRFLLRAMAIVPLAAVFARDMRRRGVVHQHAHWATHPALAALVVRELTGIPYSVTVHAHDLYVDRTMLEEKLLDARLVVTISDHNRALLQELYPDAVAGKLEVVRCGIDLERFPQRPDRPPGNPFRILCVAGLRDYKGHRHLIDALAVLRRRGVHARLELIGDGPLRGELERRARAAGLERTVVFHGARGADAVSAAMEVADAFALPSVVTASGKMEGLPVVLMEAMARGVPVVASDLSGIPELVEDGVSGLLVPPGAASALAGALERLWTDPELGRRLAAKGAARARRDHDVAANTDRLLALIAGDAAQSAEVVR